MPTLYKNQPSPSQPAIEEETPSHARLFEGLLLFCALGLIELGALGQSAMKFFWYDELVTLRIAHLDSLSSIFQFFNSGKDTTGLLPAVIVHAMGYVPGRPEIVARLPFELAYLMTCACLYRFVRRRYPAGFALCGVFSLALGYAIYYATEIRSYAFLTLGSAIACVAWQALNDRRRSRTLVTVALAVAMGSGLSIAILFHVFGGFLVVPFAIAQFVNDRRAGRPLWPAWAAFALFPLSVLPLVPGILAAKQIYGKTFWSPPTLRSLMEVYNDFADTPAKLFPVFLILLAVYLWRRRSGLHQPGQLTDSLGFSLGEWVLLFTLGLFPVICFIGSLPLGVYRVQYVMPFFFGAAILVISLVAEFTQRSSRTGLALAGALALLFCGQQKIRIAQGVICLLGRPATVTLPTEYNAAWYKAVSSSSLPIVADGADTFLVLEHYGPPELSKRLTILTSNSRARLQPNSMTNELNMETFGRTLGYDVQDCDTFLAAHRDFLVVADTAQFEYTWLTSSLLHQAAQRPAIQVSFFPGPEQLDHNDQTFLVHYPGQVKE